ncbi:MAG: sigma-70 family RNA polymerase sigma factor [Rhodothermales bacterium]
MSDSTRFDVAVVEKARKGDDAALRTVVEKVEPMLRAYFTSRIGRRSEVDDLVQNTLVRLHRGISDLNDARRLKSFTMKAAVFELQDYYRGRYRAKEHLYDPDHPPTAASSSEPPAGTHYDFERVMSILSDKARTILEMREYGYLYAEIADALDTTEAAVKMQVKRAFEKLRETFDDT